MELYRRLERETGQATGWKMNGGLRLACNPDRMTEIRRQATTAHSFGLDMQILTPREAQALWPVMDVEDVVGAAFLPTDGQANPRRHQPGPCPGGAEARRADSSNTVPSPVSGWKRAG